MIDGLLYRVEQFLHTAPKRGKDATFRLAPAIALIRELAPDLGPASRVLSIGPRNDVELRLLEATGWVVKGLDLFPAPGSKMIRRGDMHRLPYGPNQFDLVFASHAIEHAHTPAQAIREMIRVTRPEGVLWAAVPRDFQPNRHDVVVTIDDFVTAQPGALRAVYGDMPAGQRRFLFRVQKQPRVLVVHGATSTPIIQRWAALVAVLTARHCQPLSLDGDELPRPWLFSRWSPSPAATQTIRDLRVDAVLVIAQTGAERDLVAAARRAHVPVVTDDACGCSPDRTVEAVLTACGVRS